jgi:cerevisin
MRGLVGFSLLPLLASSAPTFSTETIHEGAAPLLSSSNSVEVPDSYIVVFKKHVSEAAASDHHNWVQDIHLESENVRTELRKRGQFPITTDIFEGIKHTYNIAGDFLGYSGHFDDSVIEKVRRHPDVSSSKTASIRFTHTLSPSPTNWEMILPFVTLSWLLPSRYHLYLRSRSST